MTYRTFVRSRAPARPGAVARPRGQRGGSPRTVAAAGAAARERILATAERQFAEAGFHGASIRTLAQELRMAGATVMHHFPTKEKLYAAVLERIAVELVAVMDQALGEAEDGGSRATAAADRARLRRVCESLIAWTERSPERSRLLLRELLDNPQRLRRARKLYLAPVVQRLAGFVEQAQGRGSFRPFHPLVVLHHLVGSVSYFQAALPTTSRMDPRITAAELRARFRQELPQLVEAALVRRS